MPHQARKPMPTSTSHVPVCAAHGAALGHQKQAAQARSLVAWAVAQRTNALRFGWNRAIGVQAPMARLQVWLAHNPAPSIRTMHAFWQSHDADVAIVMPGNAAGKARMRQLQTILNTNDQ